MSKTFSLNDSGSRISPDNVNKSYLFNHQSKLHIDHNCRQRRWIERNNDAINRSSHIRTFVQNNNPHQTKRAKHLPYPHLPSTFFLSSSTQLAIILFVLFNCLIHCPFSSGQGLIYVLSINSNLYMHDRLMHLWALCACSCRVQSSSTTKPKERFVLTNGIC
ncbi:hypothetical protein BLOT_001315 [Blomia tropicalis]|nr:hypothetical protein BLOT_001315 [Blomia tropicalis]